MRLANVPTPQPNPRVSPVRDADAVDRHAELVGDDLGEDRLVALALARQAGRHGHRAVDLHVDGRALVRADPGPLDVAGDPEPDPAALAARRPVRRFSKPS